MAERTGRPIGSKDKKKRKKIKRKHTKKKSAASTPPKVEPSTKPEEITPHPRVGKEVESYGPRNLDFEEKLDLPPKSEPPKPEPPTSEPVIVGKEDEQQLEIKMIADFLKLPFTLWASRIKMPAMRLTEDEAKEWAESTKTLLKHYMPLIPPIAYAWFAWSITTITIMDKRLELIAAEKKKRTNRQPQAPPEPPQVGRPINSGTEPQGAPAYKPKKG